MAIHGRGFPSTVIAFHNRFRPPPPPPPEEVGREHILHPWKLVYRRFYPHYAFFPQDFDAPPLPVEHTDAGLILHPWKLKRTQFYPYYTYRQTADGAPTDEFGGRDLLLRPWKLKRTKFYPYYGDRQTDDGAPSDEFGGRDLILRPWVKRYRKFYPHFLYWTQDFDAPVDTAETGPLLRSWRLQRTRFFPYYAYRPTDDGAPSDEFGGRDVLLHPWEIRPWRSLAHFLYPSTDIEAAAPEVDTSLIWMPQPRRAGFARFHQHYIFTTHDEDAPVAVVDEGGLITFLYRWKKGWYHPSVLLYPGFEHDESVVVAAAMRREWRKQQSWHRSWEGT